MHKEEIKNLLPANQSINNQATDSPTGLMIDSDISQDTTPEPNTVLDLMGYDAINFDALQQLTALTTEALSAMLMMLELDSKITVLKGSQYQRLT